MSNQIVKANVQQVKAGRVESFEGVRIPINLIVRGRSSLRLHHDGTIFKAVGLTENDIKELLPDQGAYEMAMALFNAAERMERSK